MEPNFFVIGAGRCGTTALAAAIDEHPQAFVTAPKEPHFLALAGMRPAFTGPGDDVTINRVAVTDLSAYLDLYRGAGGAVARGDASVSTLYYADRASKAIEQHFPAARLIVVLRDPVARAHSAFLYLRARGFEPLDDFEAALDAEPQRIEAGWHHLWHYVAMGRYAEQLAPFVAAFGHDRVLVLEHRDLEHDAADVVATVDRFLGLDPRPPAPVGRVNVSGVHRWGPIARAVAMVERRPGIKQLIRRATPFAVRQRLRTAVLRDEAVPPDAAARLHERFVDANAALVQLLGRDLSFTS